jgi:hypothetical protein
MATRKRDDEKPVHHERKVVHHDPRKKQAPERTAPEIGRTARSNEPAPPPSTERFAAGEKGPRTAPREQGPQLGAAEPLGTDFTTGSGAPNELGRRLSDPVAGTPPDVEVEGEQAQYDNPDLDLADEALKEEDDSVET